MWRQGFAVRRRQCPTLSLVYVRPRHVSCSGRPLLVTARLFSSDIHSTLLLLRPIDNAWEPPPPTRPPKILCVSTASTELSSHESLGSKLRRGLRVAVRMCQISVVLGPVLVTFPFIYLTCKVLPWLANRWWDYALWSIQALGPCMVKFMQWASTRRDLLAPEICDMLEPIQWQTKPHSWAATAKILESLGPDWGRRLAVDKNSVMLGSGSVAQVYKGVTDMQDPSDPTSPPLSRAVAVKVIHPRIKEQIELDIELMRTAAWFAERGGYLQWWSLQEFVGEFATIMLSQLDLKQEARNLDRFRDNFKKHREVIFPEPLHSLSNEVVLVEDFVHGTPISQILKDTSFPADEKKRLARVGLDAFLKMVFLDNYVHADLHPGNIFVTENPADRLKPNLTFIDAGIVTHLTPQDRRNFVDLFYAIATGQGEEAGRLMIERARHHACDDTEGFAKGIGVIVKEAVGNRLMLAKIRVGFLIQKVLALCLQYHVKLESHFASILLGIGVLEGVGRSLDPELDILTAATPVIVKSHLYSTLPRRLTRRFTGPIGDEEQKD